MSTVTLKSLHQTGSRCCHIAEHLEAELEITRGEFSTTDQPVFDSLSDKLQQARALGDFLGKLGHPLADMRFNKAQLSSLSDWLQGVGDFYNELREIGKEASGDESKQMQMIQKFPGSDFPTDCRRVAQVFLAAASYTKELSQGGK